MSIVHSRGERSRTLWLFLFVVSFMSACGLDRMPAKSTSVLEDAGSYTAPPEGVIGSSDDHHVLEAIITPTTVDAGTQHCGNGVLEIGEQCDSGSNACCNDTCSGPKPKGEICRAAAGGCDLEETCDGIAPDCPDDALEANGHECRAVVGDCDVAETCDGKSAACPDDAFKPASVRCRDATGDCDVAETCDGKTANCPDDGVAASDVRCRDATDDCDVAENCDGKTKTCPPDAVASAGTECRASPPDALCDLPEVCDGASKLCPPPTTVVAPAGRACRPAAGLCDAEEQCDGQTTQCPADRLQAAGTACRASVGNCDIADVCDGQSAACPDVVLPSSTVCRAVANGDDCDVAEHCDGVSGMCPADSVVPQGTVCRAVANGDDCDVPESCDGTSKSCPSDAVADNTRVCRAKNGVCDVAESCNGGKRCPSDAFATSGVCRPVSSGNDCDVAESCNGASADCPPDGFVPAANRQVCRAANGACDVAEVCSGGPTCPSDAFSSGNVCRKADPADLCAADVTCDGMSGACPNTNPRLADGTACNSGLGKCWSDICCPGVTKASATSACALPAGRNIVFVSSSDHNGGYASSGSGFAAADKVCNDLASAANLAGTYHAWLSGSVSAAAGTNARDRISSGPYLRVDGAVVASNLSTLTNTLQVSLQNPISLTESNAARANVSVWTGTSPGGTGNSQACTSWTVGTKSSSSTFGNSGQTSSTWTDGSPAGAVSTLSCDNNAALYCFQDDCPGVPVVDFANDPSNCGGCGNTCKTGQRCITGLCGNYVFVTSAATSANMGGVAGADKFCQAVASKGKIPGGSTSFTAWVSDSSSLAASRLVDGAYFRLDNKGVARNLAALLNSATTPLVNPIDVDETGATAQATRVFTGTTADGKLDAATCGDWSSAARTSTGQGGVPTGADATWTQNGPINCAVTASLYCFETDPALIK